MRPLRTALIVAGVYLIVSAIYVTGSDWLVVTLASSKEELDSLQSIKGLAYITLVALGLFGGLYYLLEHISKQVEDIQSKKDLLLDRERKVMVGTLAASIVHDINNLLGAIKPNLRYALDTADITGEAREAIDDAQLATDELIAMVKRLRGVSKQHRDEHKLPVDIGELVSETVEMLEPHAALRQCTIECDCAPGTTITVYPSLLRHALINLLMNASDATDRRGHIRITLETSDVGVELSVDDDGPGIPEHERERVLEPFATSKSEGMGLGLFAVTYCTRRHQGTFVIEDSELGGTRVRIVLPSLLPGDAVGAGASGGAGSSGGT